MTTSHTPGPWTVGRASEFRNQTPIQPAIGCAYGTGDEVKANARLIAAAPDLLEALRAVVSVADRATHEFNLAHAAIAKATGAA